MDVELCRITIEYELKVRIWQWKLQLPDKFNDSATFDYFILTAIIINVYVIVNYMYRQCFKEPIFIKYRILMLYLPKLFNIFVIMREFLMFTYSFQEL